MAAGLSTRSACSRARTCGHAHAYGETLIRTCLSAFCTREHEYARRHGSRCAHRHVLEHVARAWVRGLCLDRVAVHTRLHTCLHTCRKTHRVNIQSPSSPATLLSHRYKKKAKMLKLWPHESQHPAHVRSAGAACMCVPGLGRVGPELVRGRLWLGMRLAMQAQSQRKKTKMFKMWPWRLRPSSARGALLARAETKAHFSQP